MEFDAGETDSAGRKSDFDGPKSDIGRTIFKVAEGRTDIAARISKVDAALLDFAGGQIDIAERIS